MLHSEFKASLSYGFTVWVDLNLFNHLHCLCFQFFVIINSAIPAFLAREYPGNWNIFLLCVG